MVGRVLRLAFFLLLAGTGIHGTRLHAAIPVSAEFVARAGDPRGGDAGFNTFQRLPDGRGITFGGFSHDRIGNNAVVAYHPVADRWEYLQPHIPWIDTYDVSGRTFLGNRDDHLTMIVDGQYWATDGQRGVPLIGNYRGVFDVATRTWTIDDDPKLFSPTGTSFGDWMLSAADWHAVLDVGYIFGGVVNGNPTDGLLIVERNPAGSASKFRFTEYRRGEDDDPAFSGAERLYYLNNQHWQRGRFVHVYGGRQQIRHAYPDTRVDSRNLWQLELTHPPKLTSLSTNTLPDGQRVDGNRLYAYHDPSRDIAVVSNGKLVNVYDYATGLWHYVPVLTPPDADRESPSPQGAGRAGFYSPEAGQYVILGGHGRVYGLKLNFSGATVPSAPLSVTASAGNASATVSFSAPASAGGSPVTGYTVSSTPAGGVDAQAGSASMTRTITGLANGTIYRFTVTATNAVGTGPPSAPSNAITPTAPATAPAAPRNVAATAGNGSATVSFLPPSSDGGSAITQYVVTSNPAGGVDQQAGTAATTRMVTGLANGMSYTFTVTATNGVGTGPASAPSNAVVPAAPVVVPGTARNVAAIAGNASAKITFDAPAANGGSPITRYAVLANPPGGVDQQAGTAATTRTLTGLANGITYTFTVTATNAVGTGPASAPSNAVVPAAPVVVPGTARNVAAIAGNASAKITFDAPAADGGSPITRYAVLANPPGGVDQQAGTAATTRTLTGLANGVTYTFAVTATNAVGTGPASTPSNAVTPAAPAVLPGAPLNVVAHADDGSATITFSPPSSDGGSPILEYTLQSSPPGAVDGQVGTTATLRTVTGLVNGVTYVFSVTAHNAMGAGTTATSNPVTPASIASVRTVIRDFDGTLTSDIVWRNDLAGRYAIWLMNGVSVRATIDLVTGANRVLTHTTDVDGDGREDLILRDLSNGATIMQRIGSRVLADPEPVLLEPDWQVTHVGDFDGDRKGDLVWRNDTTGTTSLWLMDGPALRSGVELLGLPNWKVTTVADFNGDGKSDLLWFNEVTGETAIWIMDGASYVRGSIVLADARWRPVLSGDLNGDGRADLVWRNAATGEVALWLLDGTEMIAGSVVMGGGDWEPLQAIDFSGDGRADILWRNRSTGAGGLWLMDGLTVIAGGPLTIPARAESTVGDYDANGRADVLWHVPGSDTAELWLMNGLVVTASSTLGFGSAWSVVP